MERLLCWGMGCICYPVVDMARPSSVWKRQVVTRVIITTIHLQSNTVSSQLVV